MKIRTKIIVAFLAVSLGSILLMGGFSYYLAREYLMAQKLEHLHSVAVSRREALHYVINAWEESIRMLSARLQLRALLEENSHSPSKDKVDKMRRILVDAIESVRVEEVTIFTEDGEIIVSTNRELISQNLDRYTAFLENKKARATIRDIRLGKDGRLNALIAGPIKLDGENIGYINAIVDADPISKIATNYEGLGETGETLFGRRTKDGKTKFVTPFRHDFGNSDLKSEMGFDRKNLPMARALMGQEGFEAEGVLDYRNVPVVTSTLYIDRLDWGLVAKIDKAEVLEPVYKFLWTILKFSLVLVLLTTAAGLFLGRSISGPIHELAKATKKIKDGDFSHRVGFRGQDETGILARTFDNMADSLEKSLQELRMFEAVLESSRDAVLVTDTDLKEPGPRIIYANKALSKISGYEHGELIGQSPRMLQGPDTDIEQVKAIGKALRAGEAFNGEIVNYTKAGEKYWLSLSIFPISDSEGNVVRFAAIERDVTAQKLFEEELQRTKELAEQANQTKDMFLANMSHELRTPLNSIIGLVRILVQEPDLSGEHRQTLEVVEKSSSSLLEIVNDILDISKIEAGKIELENKPFNVTGLMFSVIDQLKPLASKKGLEFKSNEGNLPLVNIIGDEFRLSRILLNLASNAIKYTEEGRVEIQGELKESGGDKIEFVCAVRDTGIGIPEDKIVHIFEKFTQAEESTERRFGGTGLGLNITKQLVELMGGNITVESKFGEGSVFTVSIPFAIAPEDAHIESKDKEQENRNHLPKSKKMPIEKARILVAEDHEFNQIFILKLLKRFGCRNYHLVTNGKDAVREFKKNTYDMILMDCHMPQMNGYEATGAIRRGEKDKKTEAAIPIIAMTADAMLGTREECLAAGMDEYISKPIDESELRTLMCGWFTFDEQKLQSRETNAGSSLNTPPADLSTLRDYADHDPDTEKELIGIFYEKSLNDLKILKENRMGGKNRDWSEAAHALKGSAGYIGAEHLKTLCGRAQDMLEATGKERENMYRKIADEHIIVCDFLREKGLLAA